MQANKGRDTQPELAVRRLVHAAGLRYRVDVRPIKNLNRRADMTFRRVKVAFFLDGCFWHGCPEHHTAPRNNAAFWAAKVEENRARDAETNARLINEGWTVVRAWEHEDPGKVAERIVHAVRTTGDSAKGDRGGSDKNPGCAQGSTPRATSHMPSGSGTSVSGMLDVNGTASTSSASKSNS